MFEVQVTILRDGEEVSSHRETLTAVHGKELELIACVLGAKGGKLDVERLARIFIIISGAGLDVFMREYGKLRLGDQVRSFKQALGL